MTTEIMIDRLKAAELTPQDWAAWAALRAENPSLYSPYFHPDYTRIVSALHNDAYVAVIKQGDNILGFLPFQQRRRSGPARPIGAPLTDYHGIISNAPLDTHITAILKGAGIGAMALPHLMNSAKPADAAPCAVMQLKGYQTVDEWRGERDSSYRRHLKSLRRRIKKTESEHGARTFIWQSQDPAHFEQLMTWKIQKFTQTGKYNVLGVNWTSALLRQLWEAGPKAELRCDLHVMSINGQPAAMDLGLTDGTTFHSWIVGYDDHFHSLSPGMQLLESLVDQAHVLGYENIDLGAGLDGYKKHYATWPHMAGADLWLGSGFTAQRARLYAAVEHKGARALKDIPGKFRRRYSQIAACDPSASGQAKAMWQAIKNGG